MIIIMNSLINYYYIAKHLALGVGIFHLMHVIEWRLLSCHLKYDNEEVILVGVLPALLIFSQSTLCKHATPIM